MPNGRGVSAQQASGGEVGLEWPAALLPPSKGEEGAIEVALFWGDRLLDVRQFKDGERPTLGHLPQDTLHVFSKHIGAGFALIRTEGEERILCVPPGARLAVFGPGENSAGEDEGSLRQRGRLREAEDRPVWEVIFEHGERAVFAVGGLRITVRDVSPSARVRPLLIRGRDFSFIKLSVVTALIALAVLTVGALSMRSDVVVDDAVFTGRPAVLTVKSFKPEKPKPPPEKITLKSSSEAPSEPTRTDRHRSGGGKVDPKKVGLAGMISELRGGAGSIFSGGGLGHRIDTALGNLRNGGNTVGEVGVGGMGSRGTGPGGPGDGPFGIGGVGTVGGGGDGPHRIGLGSGHLRSHVTPSPEKTRIEGGLDRDQIARVIRQHESEIKYCYESALNQEPDLQGKVAVLFTIDPAGSVSDALVAESTIGSNNVEACIVRRIRRWHFPEPRGGGVVSVNFPWLFRPAGAE